MTRADRRKHKKMIKKFSEFVDALNRYNRCAAQQDQVNLNTSKITEELFKPNDAVK